MSLPFAQTSSFHANLLLHACPSPFAQTSSFHASLLRACRDFMHVPLLRANPFLSCKPPMRMSRDTWFSLSCTGFRLVYQIKRQQRDLASPMIQVQTSDNIRSEEHTSELQSRGHLVCRLL